MSPDGGEPPVEPSTLSTGDVERAVRQHSGITGARAGDSIGPYRLLGLLGEGGFGEVWLAERREPFVQRVALKLIKPGMDSRAVIARFEQERQALAVMDHPNVAKVLDGGVTDQGRPFFVMEFVKGEPITVYCDRNRLSIKDRLELFIPVCEAVQHAHMKGIIHRDIKPSNVLVSVIDSQAVPKVIDFGVAKAINQTLTEKTIFTEQGQLIGTPEYMSPEQAEMGATDIDTRTDVYSLGVLLYELLTGLLPFDSKTLRSAGFAEVQRFIREVEPPTPVKRLLAQSPPAAGDSQKPPPWVNPLDTAERLRQLRGGLEGIPLKAMRKRRQERNETPTELARDVQRFLRGEPLVGVRLRLGERARRLARRHGRRGAALAVVLFLILGPAGGLGHLARGYQHAQAWASARVWSLHRRASSADGPAGLVKRFRLEAYRVAEPPVEWDPVLRRYGGLGPPDERQPVPAAFAAELAREFDVLEVELCPTSTGWARPRIGRPTVRVHPFKDLAGPDAMPTHLSAYKYICTQAEEFYRQRFRAGFVSMTAGPDEAAYPGDYVLGDDGSPFDLHLGDRDLLGISIALGHYSRGN